MQYSMVTTAYIIAAVLFIMALAGLAQQESAKRGIWLGMIGMIIALAATILSPEVIKLNIHKFKVKLFKTYSAFFILYKYSFYQQNN